jgi:threonine/homoserine/homoserine lactone efflux protein
MDAGLVAFVGVAVVVVTPGPDTALTLRNALVGGRRAGVLTAVGVVGGQAIWTLATSAGIAALLVASRPAFTALRYAGAAYLIYLGLRSLLAAARGGRVPPPDRGTEPPPRVAAFRQGVISNLANPKSAVFFTSLLPQFVPAGGASFLALLALGLVYCSITLAWLSAYAVAVARVGVVLRRPIVRRAVEAVTGVVLTALGLRLATERH